MSKSTEFKDRMAELLSHYKLNPGEMARIVGCNRGTMYNIVSGSTKPDFKTSMAILEKFPEVSAEWLMRGDGSMMRRSMADDVEVQELQQKVKVLERLYTNALLGKGEGMTLARLTDPMVASVLLNAIVDDNEKGGESALSQVKEILAAQVNQ